MSKTHNIKTVMPFFQEVLSGKKPYEYRLNDRNYQVGDELHHIEWDATEQKETGRQCWAKIVHVLNGGVFGIPEGYCILTQHTTALSDFIRDYARIENLLKDYEEKLSFRMGADMSERIAHVLSTFNKAATESTWKGKNFLEDVKTQFKAIEITLEGLASEAYNHGQKRVIANHVINILRNCVDRIDRVKWDYQNSMYEHFNYFRSESPEGDLMKRYRTLKEENERLKSNVEFAKSKLPDEVKDDLPF
jgi:hypothetical protein